jgi:serine/threonine protein kinase/tetratricopeptide (TPR) repeat protein
VSVGSYEAIELLGAGGIGRVYKAIHRPSGRAVALKTVHGSRPAADVYRLLVREAAAVAQLCHPSVVELLDFVVDGGRTFLVLELVGGGNADPWIDQWPGRSVIAAAIDQVLDGLAAAHAAGILHRDLKPSNLLRASDGRIKIADFGMAELFDPLASDPDRAFGGTPLYMAPEQLDPAGHQGPWTDLYSVGVIAHVLLSGSDQLLETAGDWRVAKRQPFPPLRARPGLGIPRELRRLLAQLVDPDPAQRPRFAAELRAALAAQWERIEEHAPAETVPLPPETWRSSSELASAPTAAVSSLGSFRDSELSSAPTQVAHLVSASASSSTGSGTEGPSASLALPALELPFVLPGPASVDVTPSLARLRSPPLVGRQHERRELSELARAMAEERTPRVLLLVGEAGVGKSRLARWLLAQAERSFLFESAACGYDVSGTTDGLRRALQRLFGACSDGSLRAPAARSLAAAPEGLDLARLRAWLAGEVDARPSHAERVELSALALGAVARHRPVLVWFDDIAWSHDGALEVMERVLADRSAAVLFVATVRAGSAEHPDVRARIDALRARVGFQEWEVGRLSTEERAELLAVAAPLGAAVCRELASALDETPLLLVALAQDLVDSETLCAGVDGYTPAGGRSVAEILAERPPSRLLGARLDKLINAFGDRGVDAEQVLIAASLIGHRFDESALVASVRGAARRRFVQAVLARALLHGILRSEPGAGHRFEHDLLRVASRERLELRADRDEILARVAHGIVRAHGEDHAETNIQAALLLREAGSLDAALERLASAATDLALLRDPSAQEQVELARRWIDAEPSDARRASWLAMSGWVNFYFSRYDLALRDLGEGRALARLVGDTLLEHGCMAGQFDVHFFEGRFSESERLARRVLDACPLDDPRWAIHGLDAAYRLAELAALRRDYTETVRQYRLAVEYARRAPGQRRRSNMVISLAEAELARGEIAEARALLDALGRRARRPRAAVWREYLADAELNYRVRIGDSQSVREDLSLRIAKLLERRDLWRLTAARVLDALAAAQTDAQDTELAVERMLEAFAACSHEKPFTLWALDQLARRLLELGRTGAAARVDDLIESERARFGR